MTLLLGKMTDHAATNASVCSIVENRLQCINLQTQDEVFIEIDDIISILPVPGENENEYSMVFFEKHDGSTTEDCTRLIRIKTTRIPPTLLSQYFYRELPGHLCSFSCQNISIHVVISTCSGTGKARNVFRNALRPFLSYLGLTRYEVHETESARTITELAHSKFLPCAEAGIRQTIILLSGDGGLVDIVNAFYNSTRRALVPPCIALIPVGTGNAMANSIGLLHPAMGLVALLQGKPKHMPVFVASFSPEARYIIDEGRARAPICSNSVSENQDQRIYGAVVASWGIHAALVADSDTVEYRRSGADRFKLAAKELLCPSDGSPTHTYRAGITLIKKGGATENRQHMESMKSMEHDQHMYVLATFVSRLEKGFVISPDSYPLDGCLRLVHFAPIPPDEAMQLMGKAYQGGLHVHEEAVTYTEIEGFRIDFREQDERWRRVCVDGKIIAVEQGGWMEVRKESRNLVDLIVGTP